MKPFFLLFLFLSLAASGCAQQTNDTLEKPVPIYTDKNWDRFYCDKEWKPHNAPKSLAGLIGKSQMSIHSSTYSFTDDKNAKGEHYTLLDSGVADIWNMDYYVRGELVYLHYHKDTNMDDDTDVFRFHRCRDRMVLIGLHEYAYGHEWIFLEEEKNEGK